MKNEKYYLFETIIIPLLYKKLNFTNPGGRVEK